MEKWEWDVFGGYGRRGRRCRRHRRLKRVSSFRVIKVNLSFGELKLFQMAQNFNIIWWMSYIYCMKFFFEES